MNPFSALNESFCSVLSTPPVLRERLTERELDFLNLPLSSLRHRVNRDRLSMTTDELLSIPHDGSMPVTHTSAFLQGARSSSLLCLCLLYDVTMFDVVRRQFNVNLRL